MKQGNQFYLELQLEDEQNNLLDISSVSKVQFNIGNLTKEYDGISQEVLYDTVNNSFQIYLTEEETFPLNGEISMDARILFRNDIILGTYIINKYFYDSLKEVRLDV